MSSRLHLRLLAIVALLVPASANPPTWWADGHPPILTGTAENNQGPANIGQAKWMVAEALRALDTAAPTIATQIRADLAGTQPDHSDRVIDLTVPDPKDPAWIENQKSPLLIGQLKAISAPFYTRLNATNPTWLATERTTNGTDHPGTIFPWTRETTDDANQATATIGQLKAVFSLRFESLDPFDIDGDSLPDAWELQYFGNLEQTASGDFNNDGRTNAQEFAEGTQPNNPDSDGDKTLNEDDADPKDAEINWPKTPESRYVWVEQKLDSSEYGTPIAVNKLGQILFSKKLWNSATQAPINLLSSGSLQVVWEGNSYILNSPFLGLCDINDDGTVFGYGHAADLIDMGYNWLPFGMVWKRNGSALDAYDTPVYFLDKYPVEKYSPDSFGLPECASALANDGTILGYMYDDDYVHQTWKTYDSKSDGHGMTPVVGADGLLVEGNPYNPAYSILDKNRMLLVGWSGDQQTQSNILLVEGHARSDTGLANRRWAAINLAPTRKDDEGERLWISNGNTVLLEKLGGGSGASRWHNPPSMNEGASFLNPSGIALVKESPDYDSATGKGTPPKLWRNGKYTDLNDKNLTEKPTSVNITAAIDLASNGIILAEATEGGVKKTGLLFPVMLTDTKDKVLDPVATFVPEKNRDVIIEAKENDNDKNPKSIAWIEPHGSEETIDAPDMPQLVLRFPGTEHSGLKIKWKLKVEYMRPNGRTLNPNEDKIEIPDADGWVTEVLDGGVKIYDNAKWQTELQQKGFFGGDAELTFQFLKEDDSAQGSPISYKFSIAGKNPDNTKAREYLSISQPDLWFAYAICKHETAEYRYSGTFYNQFVGNPKGKTLNYSSFNRSFSLAYGSPTWNWDFSDSKPGGFGLFQVTGWQGSGNGNIPRAVIWNWQTNMVEGANEIRRDKVPDATNYFNAVKSKYGQSTPDPPITATGKTRNLTGWEVSVIVRYNGVGGTDSHPVLRPWLGQYTQDPWTYSGGTWYGPKPNMQNYLNVVITEIE